jgi:hypothetical protein
MGRVPHSAGNSPIIANPLNPLITSRGEEPQRSFQMLQKLKNRINKGYIWHTHHTLPVMVTTNRIVFLVLLILGAWVGVQLYFR